jgi:hypothetical protein
MAAKAADIGCRPRLVDFCMAMLVHSKRGQKLRCLSTHPIACCTDPASLPCQRCHAPSTHPQPSAAFLGHQQAHPCMPPTSHLQQMARRHSGNPPCAGPWTAV